MKSGLVGRVTFGGSGLGHEPPPFRGV